MNLIRQIKFDCTFVTMATVKFLNFGTPEIFAVIYLKFKQRGQTVYGRNLCCNLPKIQTKRPNLRVFSQEDVNGIANSEDPDQTAPGSSLIWVCTVCPDLSVRKLRVITVLIVSLLSYLQLSHFGLP